MAGAEAMRLYTGDWMAQRAGFSSLAAAGWCKP